ncbi:hypothetical protein ABK040_016390 [Willaertia magna]
MALKEIKETLSKVFVNEIKEKQEDKAKDKDKCIPKNIDNIVQEVLIKTNARERVDKKCPPLQGSDSIIAEYEAAKATLFNLYITSCQLTKSSLKLEEAITTIKRKLVHLQLLFKDKETVRVFSSMNNFVLWKEFENKVATAYKCTHKKNQTFKIVP